MASRPAPPIWTGGPADEEPLGLPKCCQPGRVDKASVLEAGRPASAGKRSQGAVHTSDSACRQRSGPGINGSPLGPCRARRGPLTAVQPRALSPGLPHHGAPERPGCSRKNTRAAESAVSAQAGR